MAPLTIDFLATAEATDTTSGLSRGVWELSAALVGRGHRVRVLYPSTGSLTAPPRRGVAAVPVPVVGVGRRPFGRDIAIGRAASALLDPHADVVVGNDEKAGALQLPRTGRPVPVQFVHDVALHTFDTLRPLEPDRGLRQRLGNWMDRRALRKLEGDALARARLIVVASELNRQLLERSYRVPASKVALLPHGVPDPVDVGSVADARRALKVPLDVPIVSFVGRTPERQGLDIALAAFRRIRVLFSGVRLVVVGTTVPTEPGVLSLGVVDETTKARVYRASDVFVFPARYEGFGLAPREAMRYGVSTIASRHVPLDGLPKDAARVVRDDDPGSYASELADLLSDPALRRRVGQAGREWADRFSYARMAERLESLLAPHVGR